MTMTHFRLLLTLSLLSLCFHAPARVVSDTLYSPQNDRVIVSYELRQDNEKAEIKFTSIRIRLGDPLYDKYKNTSKISAMFFDRVGGFNDIRFSGVTPKALFTTSGLGFSPSSDGYYIFDPYQYPTLAFDLPPAEEASVTIPIYLAHYEKKRNYEILCQCGSLEIKLGTRPSPKAPVANGNETALRQTEAPFGQTLTEEEDRALNMVNSIMSSLPNQTEGLDATLEQEVRNLVDLKSAIKNEDVLKRIKETTEAFEKKKREIAETQKAREAEQMATNADNDAFNHCTTIEACDLYLNSYPEGLHVEEVKAKKAELEAKALEKENKEKKRNIWMIIGGALLAILLFAGNQVMQTFRNKRTQRSMMQMQQEAINKAQNAAKGKIQGAARKQTNQARQKGKEAVRNALNNTSTSNPKGKGSNNRISI